MISSGERILNIIELITKYDIPTVSSTALRVRTEMTTEGPDSNLITVLKDRVSSSELSDVSKGFKSIAVNNNDDVEELQLKNASVISIITRRMSLTASNLA